MKVNELYKLFYKIADPKDPEKLLPWIKEKLGYNEKNIDLRYLYLEILRWNNFDLEDDKEEPEVLKICTEIIRNNSENDCIEKAKAYAYRGEMRHFGIDRRKDFDKAKLILSHLPKDDPEVFFLSEFINSLYSQYFRQYLPIYTNYLNFLMI